MHSARTRRDPAASRAGAVPVRTSDGPGSVVLTRLRSSTADAHRRVEARLFPSALTGRAAYTGMLQVLLALHEPHEKRFGDLGGFDVLGIDLPARRKAPQLRADLVALHGAEPPVHGRSRAPLGSLPNDDPPNDDLMAALGAFYVLEGSTLGGRVLLREVRERLGDVPTGFLAGYGDQTGHRWKQTRAALVAGVATAPAFDQAADRLVRGAIDTFAELDRLLDEYGWSA
jgi:heme oxygenase